MSKMSNAQKRIVYLVVVLIGTIFINLGIFIFTDTEEAPKKDQCEMLQFHNIIITEE